MIGARIGGELDCSGVTITNPSGAALHGEHLQVAGNLSLRAASPPTVTVSWARYGWSGRTSVAISAQRTLVDPDLRWSK
jgi:hypothetical protein